ncbi:uncharacterized protein LOC34624468 [Cyclospora cayetanensis]|uniref:Uncharacterized protein LOC34624468 n=1 Tax=Cyclospora cayetanensis TaxID=88456 RepID=A0A6P6RZW6_9EIME|nr:uncharacterized protein LOC34624468 [Cyclospora cayetanensis]
MNCCRPDGTNVDPTRIVFPTECDPKEITLRDGLVYSSRYDVTLTQPGYYALSISNKTEPLWDAFFLGITRMHLECEYHLEPPTESPAEAFTWTASGGTALYPSLSGIMQLVSNKAGAGTKSLVNETSFGTVSGKFQGSRKPTGSSLSTCWKLEETPNSLPPEVLSDIRSASSEGKSLTKSTSKRLSSSRLGSKETLSGKQKVRELELLPAVQELGSDTTSEGKGILGEWEPERVENQGAPSETKVHVRNQNSEQLTRAEQAVEGISVEGLFTGSSENSSKTVLTLAALPCTGGHNKDGLNRTKSLEETCQVGAAGEPSIQNQMSKLRSEGRPYKPSAEASEKLSHGGGTEGLSPLSVAEKGRQSGQTMASTDDPGGEQLKDKSVSQSREEPDTAGYHEERSDGTKPSMPGADTSTVANQKRDSVTDQEPRDEALSTGRAACTEVQCLTDGKISIQALTLLSLQSRILQMATGSEWGELFGGPSHLPWGTHEEELGELREDVLFYEAEGHYTDSGEEYCLPLGEQQQLVKFLPSNVVSVRARKRKFSFMFAPFPGSHLLIDVRASMSLGMSLLGSIELVYCGIPPPLYQAPPTLYIATGRKCILSLDGAGLYGAVGQLVMLRQLEKEVRFLLGDTRLNVAACFDLIVGTGTGGLLALALLRGITLSRLLKEWAGICGKSPKQLSSDWRESFFIQIISGIHPTTLRSELVDKFGWQFLNTLKAPLGIITCSDAAQSPPQPFALRTFEHAYPPNHVRSHRGTSRCPLWVAAWATIASPGTLRAIRPEDFKSMGFSVEPSIKLTGATTAGALAANPTLVGLDECSRLVHKPLRSFIQSDLQLVASFGARECFGFPSTRQEAMEPFATESLTAATTCTHRETLHWLADRLDVYFRFNIPLVRGVVLSPLDPQGLMDLMAIATEYITDEKFFEVKKAAKILACHLRARLNDQCIK